MSDCTSMEERHLGNHRALALVFEGTSRIDDLQAVKPSVVDYLDAHPNTVLIIDLTKLSGTEFSVKAVGEVRDIFYHDSVAKIAVLGLAKRNILINMMVNIGTQLFGKGRMVLQPETEEELRVKLDDLVARGL